MSGLNLTALSTVERISSTLSLIGCLFIIISFVMCEAFHKPVHRLIFYASIGNVFASVATIMGPSFIPKPDAFPCQLQGFLIQMFMPADAYWSLAMACNVYLTFYWKHDGQQLKRMELPYLIICYGAPFVPAFVYIFVKVPGQGRVYGDATIWCWVQGGKWDFLRVATFYGPVWIAMLLTILIYVRTGREIFKRRKQLEYMAASVSGGANTMNRDRPEPEVPQPLNSNVVKITSEVIRQEEPNILSPGQGDNGRFPNPDGGCETEIGEGGLKNYSVCITAGAVDGDATFLDLDSDPEPAMPTTTSTVFETRSPPYRAAARASAKAAWAYTKVAVLFFLAMTITWLPSSANRVYSLVHENSIIPGLEYTSAAVLPLQGFWNFIIYVATSLPACQLLWEQIVDWCGQSTRKKDGLEVLPDNKSEDRRELAWDSSAHALTEMKGVRTPGFESEADSIRECHSRPETASQYTQHC